MTDKGLAAMMEKKFKLGAEASIAMGPVAGAGVRGATTANLGADIYAYAVTRGVFGGVSFDGTAVIEREAWNRSYYGDGASARGIIVEQKFSNESAEPQRRALAGK